MLTGIIVGLVVALVVVGIVVGVAGGLSARTYRLRRRFGPEYDRLVAERANRRAAESELAERERRVETFSLRDLSEQARARFLAEWADLQELFVDAPTKAIGQGRSLVEQVMRERGYPVEEFDQTLADLSVRHARALDRFRSAHGVSEKAIADEVSTEDLRVALLNYRAMFGELLGAAVASGRVAGAAKARASAADLAASPPGAGGTEAGAAEVSANV